MKYLMQIRSVFVWLTLNVSPTNYWACAWYMFVCPWTLCLWSPTFWEWVIVKLQASKAQHALMRTEAYSPVFFPCFLSNLIFFVCSFYNLLRIRFFILILSNCIYSFSAETNHVSQFLQTPYKDLCLWAATVGQMWPNHFILQALSM